jgi:hypothetical protein
VGRDVPFRAGARVPAQGVPNARHEIRETRQRRVPVEALGVRDEQAHDADEVVGVPVAVHEALRGRNVAARKEAPEGAPADGFDPDVEPGRRVPEMAHRSVGKGERRGASTEALEARENGPRAEAVERPGPAGEALDVVVGNGGQAQGTHVRLLANGDRGGPPA